MTIKSTHKWEFNMSKIKKKELEKRIESLEEELRELKESLKKEVEETTAPWYLNAPKAIKLNMCTKCGIPIESTMNYVCTKPGCPSGLGPAFG